MAAYEYADKYAAYCRAGHLVAPCENTKVHTTTQSNKAAQSINTTDAVVLMPTRNNAEYWQTTFPSLYKIMQDQWNTVLFFIWENDSTDGTNVLLDQLSSALNNIHVMHDHLPSINALTLRCTARTARLALIRNALMGWAMPFITLTTRVILLDTNVVFTKQTLVYLEKAIVKDHVKDINPDAACNNDTISMACADTREAQEPTHYYDTYALQLCNETYAKANNTKCLWQTCRKCQGPYDNMNQNNIIVRSAFGGLAMLLGSSWPGPWWQSLYNECEHVSFCQQLPGHAVIVPQAKAVWNP
jgi:hypothetical protein